METEITSVQELRECLSRFWLAEYECKLARDELKKQRAIIMEPVRNFQKEIKALQPKIQNYMLKNDMPRLRSEGREFHLKSRKSTRKVNIDELCSLFACNQLNDERSINTLNDVRHQSTKISHRIVVPLTKEEDAVVDLEA